MGLVLEMESIQNHEKQDGKDGTEMRRHDDD